MVSVTRDMDESQISYWFREWLEGARKRHGHSQEVAAREAGVGTGVVRATEQSGRLPEVPNFLRLITRYGGEGELVNQIRTWREASRQPEGTAPVMPPPGKGATAIAAAYKEAEANPPKPSRKKPRAKDRSA